MRKLESIVLISLLVMVVVLNISARNNVNIRVLNGVYYDYMVVATEDGNEWLLSDENSPINPYMIYDSEIDEYVARFKHGEYVTVVFDTRGTDSILDDVIIKVERDS